MVDARIVEHGDPEDVFTLVSDEIRVEILQALWETDQPVGFSDLHEAVEIRDSGQFNYHLDKLVGKFVRKTPEGYELTQAGKSINGAIEAGAYTLEATIEPIELTDPCPFCGGSRTFTYEDEVVSIECESCEISYRFVVPPGVFAGYDEEPIPRVASRYLHATFHQIQSGFCWFCEGPTVPSVEIEGAPTAADGGGGPTNGESGESPGTKAEDSGGDDSEGPSEGGSSAVGEIPVVHYNCERCGHTATTGLWMATRDHPAVLSFYDDHGIDIRDRPVWEFPARDPDHVDVRGRDPLRASVTYSVDGETLTLVLDEAADVVEIEA